MQRYTSLIRTVQLESQCLQSYDGLLEIFRPNFEEDHPNFAGIEVQDELEQTQSNLYIFEIDHAAY